MSIEIDIIDVEITWGTPQAELLQQYRSKMLAVLLQHLPQWKTLDVEATYPLFSLIQDINFSLSPSLTEVRISLYNCPRDVHPKLLSALEKVPNLHSLDYGPSISNPSIFLRNPPFVFLTRLKRLYMTEQIPVSGMLEIVRRCPSAEWICARVLTLTTEPLVTTSSKNLRILDLSFNSSDYGTLACLHLPNLKVLIVRCIYQGGSEIMHAISKFASGESGHPLQVLRVLNLGIGLVDGLICEQGIRQIPIMEIHVKIPHNDKDGEFERVVSGCFEQWKRIDIRFKRILRPSTRLWSVGWVESKVFRWDLNSLPASILDTIETGLLV